MGFHGCLPGPGRSRTAARPGKPPTLSARATSRRRVEGTFVDLVTCSREMVRTALRKYGPFRVTLVLTVLAMLASVGVKCVLVLVMNGQITTSDVVVASIVPAIVAPLLTAYLFVLITRLDRAEERLRHMATVDDLTRIFNRRHFMALAANEMDLALRYRCPFSVLLLDVDRFKAINDKHGHLTGDRVLQALARCCRGLIRRHDILARFGGEEFVFLLPRTAVPDAAALAERIRSSLAREPVPCSGGPIHFTVSIGVATFTESTETLEDVLRAADQALYQAKARGRNRVVLSATRDLDAEDGVAGMGTPERVPSVSHQD